MNFFEQLNTVLQTGQKATLTIIRGGGASLTIGFIPEIKAGGDDEKLPSLTLTGTPEELDNEFFNHVKRQKLAAEPLTSNIEQVEKEIAEKVEENKEEAKPTKAKSESKKPAAKKAPAKQPASKAKVEKKSAHTKSEKAKKEKTPIKEKEPIPIEEAEKKPMPMPEIQKETQATLEL